MTAGPEPGTGLSHAVRMREGLRRPPTGLTAQPPGQSATLLVAAALLATLAGRALGLVGRLALAAALFALTLTVLLALLVLLTLLAL